VSAEEKELLLQVRRLSTSDLNKLIAQTKAIADVDNENVEGFNGQ
jgi:hypothetical protein